MDVCERRLSVNSDAESDQYLQYFFGHHRDRSVWLIFIFSHNGCTCIQCAMAPSPRRINGYQCTSPNCGKVFTNVFAYDQHHNHATRAGTLCASIMMREELTAVRRADRSSAVLKLGRAKVTKEMRAQSEMRAGGWACRSADMFTRDHPVTTVGNSEEFSTHGCHALNSSKYRQIALNFLSTGWPSYEGQGELTIFSRFKHYLGFLGGVLNLKNSGIQYVFGYI